MKRCPECRRDYYDETLLYCLDDGNVLLDGPSSGSLGEASTAILSRTGKERTGVLREIIDRQTDNFHSVAVLPFANLSADPENEYLCDGLAEELLNALAKIDDLKVAARTSAFSFKGKNAAADEIGQKLGVKTILEGSVRRSGNRLRITVQLVNAEDGYHLWSERYALEMKDIFDIQDEITLSVVDALKLKLLGGEKTSLLKRETENTEAYKASLKGRYLRYAKNDHRGAAAAYQEAVELDPLHAPSWLGLAESFVLRAHYGLVPSSEACSRARNALATAREIHGDTAEAFYIEGFTAFIERDWAGCDEAYRRSFLMDPNNSRSLGTFGIINCILGRKDAAMDLFQRSREADPLAAYPYAMSGSGFVVLGEPDEAVSLLEQSLAFERDNSLALWTYTEACIALRKFDEGIAAAETAVTLSRRGDFLLALLGWALASAGRTDEARAILVELRNRPPNSPKLVHEACLLGALGDKDAAFEILSRATDEFAPMACYVRMPCYDRLRDDPRFATHVKDLDLPE